jgi:hypothetical protein
LSVDDGVDVALGVDVEAEPVVPLMAPEPVALPEPLAEGEPEVPVDGAAPEALEDDESLDDGAADDVPVELAGGVALDELLDDGAVLAGGVALEDEEDEDGGVAPLLALLPSSLPHAESARATAAANSSEVLFIFNTSFKEGVITDCNG